MEELQFESLDLDAMVARVLAGEELSRAEARAILRCPDAHLPALLAATCKVREATFGRRVKICILRNAQSGICPEDCSYCSQSRVSRADIPVYKMQSIEELVEAATIAKQSGARRYCMVCSMRGPTDHDVQHLARACETIRERFPDLELCLSIGLLDLDQARTLKEAGAGWINHNLNTSRRYYPQICTTHTYDDRVNTIENVRAAGLSVCSGGIIGMGETDDDIIDLADALRQLRADSVPVNFLHPIAGTPLENAQRLNPKNASRTRACFVSSILAAKSAQPAGASSIWARARPTSSMPSIRFSSMAI